ncbi:MAG: GldG family protein, partial [Pseudomonadota bacterium]
MTSRRFLFTASLLAILIFTAANLLVQRWTPSARADLTENKLYTLSKGTQETLKDLTEPVELTFVYTASVGQAYPAVRAYAVRVREVLAAYKSQGGANLRVREIDPAPFSEAEDEALAAGLVAVDTDGGDPLYFGVIGRNSVDDERVIPFLAPEQETRLEYDLTRMLARLDRPRPPRVGLLTTLPGMAAVTDEAGYSILREMKKSFGVEPIDPSFTSLPEGMDILMLAHPPTLSDWQLWQIDQFILRTGRALILIDPSAKTAQGSGPFNLTNRQIRSDLAIFETVWGVALSDDAVADTQTALSIEADAGDGRTTVLRHPLFLSVPPALMSRSNLVTADLNRSVNLGAPGELILSEGVAGRPEALMETGPTPSAIPADEAALDMSAQDALQAYVPGDAPAILAARVTGALVTAFPAGRPTLDLPADPVFGELARADAANALPHQTTSDVDAEIIILADADLLDDALHVDLNTGVPFADNAALILNALDSLSGGSDLMSLRARAPGLRPMRTVEEMREAAQLQFFAEQARLEQRLSVIQGRLQE